MTTKPWEHQLKALEYLYDRDAAAPIPNQAVARPRLLIDLVINRGFKRVLVVAPKSPVMFGPLKSNSIQV